jgi:chemotaxis protein methyltransferase CheR
MSSTTQESLADPIELSPAAFNRFARYITTELGIKMPESKLTMVQSRLLRRVRDLRMDSLDHYCDYFFESSSTDEREHFVNAITTNKTDFFREPQHFACLLDVVLPATAQPGVRFKVWSAGCSTGEEPYTLAMVLAEYAAAHPGFDFAILATDISTRVLAAARNGIYQEPQTAPVPIPLRRKYLLRSRGQNDRSTRVVPELRRRVSFHQLNFMDPNYGIKEIFDAVFFRNVMIYFDRPTQEAVIGKICRNLQPGGYLFCGHSESLAGLNIPVQPVMASVYRKPI